MKKRIFFRKLVLFPIILSMLVSTAFVELSNYQVPVLDERFKQGELIVGLKLNNLQSATEMSRYSVNFFGDASLTSVIKKNGITRVTQLFEEVPLDSLSVKHQLPGVFILKAGRNADLYTLKRQLEAHPFVDYVEYNYTVSITAPFMPNDPQLSTQWGLSNNKNRDINAPEAWGIERGKPHVLIAVVDTGVLYTHPDLQGSRMRTDIDKDFVNKDNDAIDDQGHGTHVAGIIAASGNNGVGITGVCMNCSILPIKVLDSAGSGSINGVANGIIYAAKKGADIINLSLGMSHSCGCSKTLAKAINYAFEKGSLIVAAAGNDYVSGLAYPASSSRVMAIGASNKNDRRAAFSSYGKGLDILAPGQAILSTYNSNSYKLADGTSMAAPHAAGVAGLILSQRPNLRNTQVWWILQRTAKDLSKAGYDPVTGFGRLDAFRALTVSSIKSVSAKIDPCNKEPEDNCGDCTFTLGLDAVADATTLANSLKVLHSFRDQVLSKSKVGQRWVKLFTANTLEVSAMLFSDSDLRATTGQLILDLLPYVKHLTNGQGKSPVITQSLVSRLDQLKSLLLQKASPNLQKQITTEWRVLSIQQYVGMSVTSAWAAINGTNTLGVQDQASATPSPTVTSTSTEFSTETLTATPQPSETVEPTNTVTSTETPTETPTATETIYPTETPTNTEEPTGTVEP